MLLRSVHTEDSNMLTNSRVRLLSFLLAWQFAEGLVKCLGGVVAGVETYHHGSLSPAGCRAGKERPSASTSNSKKGQ